MTSRSSLPRALPWAAGIGFALLLAPTAAADAMLSTVEVSSTSYHWRLESNFGPTGDAWVTPDAIPSIALYGSRVDPRAWRRMPVPRLLGLDRRPDGLVWHVEGEGLTTAGDAWIGLDGHPRSVQLREASFYAKGTPDLIVTTYTYDSFDRPPPRHVAPPAPDPNGGS